MGRSGSGKNIVERTDRVFRRQSHSQTCLQCTAREIDAAANRGRARRMDLSDSTQGLMSSLYRGASVLHAAMRASKYTRVRHQRGPCGRVHGGDLKTTGWRVSGGRTAGERRFIGTSRARKDDRVKRGGGVEHR